MHLSFHGATGGVTGSCFLVEVADTRILIDCGLFQGGREMEENTAPFGFDPKSIDYVLLTHAHLDHCGRLPLLAKKGFRGKVVTTAPTRELAKLVLLDAARIQEEDAERTNRRSARRGRMSRTDPLYTTMDALDVLDRFARCARYDQPMRLARGIHARFIDAGHILGSASVLLELEHDGRHRRVLFSGDIGNRNKPIVRDPSPLPSAGVVVMESTYGDRCHRSMSATVEEFYTAVRETFERSGNVLIPTFALERAQELLFLLREGLEHSELPRQMQVFLDSPMAISATEIFRRHPDCFDADTAYLFRNGADPFTLPGLHYTREVADSMAINRFHSGALIMAGSGMCTGGRIRHHLKHNLWREACSVIFVGFAAPGTLARSIIDGASEVQLLGERVRVRARIHTINGFSAHADHDELLAWHAHTGRPATTFLVHGEPRATERLRADLHAAGHVAELPERGRLYAL
jgi:metallo-beta-lactamase family protein